MLKQSYLNKLKEQNISLLKESEKLPNEIKLKLIYLMEGYDEKLSNDELKEIENSDVKFDINTINEINKKNLNLSEILSNMTTDGICVLNSQGKVLMWNEAAKKITGFSCQEMYLKDLHEIFIPDKEKYQKQSEKFKKYQNGGENQLTNKNQEISFYDKFNNLKTIQLSVNEQYNRSSDSFIYMGIFKDVTYKRHLEKIKEQAINITKHDIKSPIASVKSVIDLLVEDLNLDKKQQKLCNIATISINEVIKKINNFLDIEKIAKGTIEIDNQDFNLSEILENLKLLFENSNKNKKIEIVFLDNIDLTNFNGDKNKIYSLFSNLIKNAFEHSDNGDTIFLEIKKSQIHSTNEESILFTIQNTQPIPEKIKENFFDQFVSFGKSGGTGLGTYSAKILTKAHGGEIDFESGEDIGTKLFVNLPNNNK